MLAVREDVDTGWALLGVGQTTNPSNDIHSTLCNATQAFVDLRDKGLEAAYDLLGYNKSELPSDVLHSLVVDNYTPEHHVSFTDSDDSKVGSGVTPLQSNSADFISSATVPMQAEQSEPADFGGHNDGISKSTTDQASLPRFDQLPPPQQ